MSFKNPLYNTDNETNKFKNILKGSDFMKKMTMMMTILSAVCVLAMTGCSSVSTTESTSGNITAELTETMVSAESETEAEAVTTEKISPRETITFDIPDSSQTETVQEETNSPETEEPTETEITVNENYTAVTASYVGNANGMIDTTDLFSSRDLEQTAELTGAQYLTVSDNNTINITEAGIYVISGTAQNCTIKVEADKEAKVQLVLDGVNLTNTNAPAIYVVSADKIFITTTQTENTLTVSGTFTADDETNTDAVIYSKDDIVLNGLGTLNIVSSSGNGITSKDDLKVSGGTYNITSALDAIEANDSISICGGTFNITSNKDGLHCENDQYEGMIYIADGNFTINSNSDGIQATTILQVDGGNFNITSAEGMEATYVQINGGIISISASDDGINATNKSSSYPVTIEFNGGDTTIVMGQGDTDAVDSNGYIYVNDGTINITASTSSFDYDMSAEYNGGTIIINGEQVSEIPQSMMGGGGFGGGFGGGRGNHGDFPNGMM